MKQVRSGPVPSGLSGRRRLTRSSIIPVIAVAILAMTAYSATAFAGSGTSDLPPSWHIHDGQLALGAQHKGIGFFPTILGISAAEYSQDPARCPDATDKAFLPSFGQSESALLRAGICMTSTAIIHVRTVPVGTSGPDGWQSLTTASEPGFVTYYLVTSN
jgi:hypothetical protein